ncbi:MAG: hypothetical protein GY718_19090, partial [Lentisphaerae bacterium]|nr:hypothetical protein [Lentisphaerota bacterium]
FDNIIDGTTVTSDTFNVDGSISGHHTSSFTGGGTNHMHQAKGIKSV